MSTPPRQAPSRIALADRAYRWLIESGIRGTGADSGAVRRQYDARARKYSDFYPEITAYALQLHLRLAGVAQGGADWQAAVESGEWLLRVQSRTPPTEGAFSYAVRDGVPFGGAFSFDTAIIGHALLELAQATQRADFTRAAEGCATWLLSQQQADGSFRAHVGEASPVGWAGDACALHGKHALLLGALWRHGGDARHRDGALRLLDWLIGLQRVDGRIDVQAGADYAMLHTVCYAIEGLLAGALWLGHPRALQAARQGARFLAAQQRPSGAVPRYCGPGAVTHLRRSGARFPRLRAAVAPADPGVTAQAIRVWTWVQHASGDDHSESIRRGIDWLAGQQIVSTDRHLDGSLPAGVDSLCGLRRREPRLYPWANVFAVDACRLQHDRSAPAALF